METTPQPSNPALRLAKDTYYQVVHTLRGLLPLPATDTPENLTRRDNAAIAHVASLLPVNADEANIAAQHVAANAYAMDCLRLAREYATADHSFFLQCNARAVSMMRQARAARTLLMRVQAERRTREADHAAADRAAWTEHCALGMMTDALGTTPPAPMAEPPPPPPQQSTEEPVADPIAEADQYAVIYPQRAARIRVLGGLPQPLDFGPPSPELVQAIITGDTPTLRALDTQAAPPA
jgi:hypothetical protein